MKTTQYYHVAEHLFGIEATEEQLAQLPNYAPFAVAQVPEQVLFMIRMQEGPMPDPASWEHVYTDTSDDDMPRIEMYRHEGSWLFRISMYKEGDVVSSMICKTDWSEVLLYADARYTRFAIDNAAMLVYAFAAADKKTLLFHSSVTVLNGKGHMFLGHSGTGKSTHSQQWLEAFAGEGAWLLNDDNPVVCIAADGQVRVYGSPWSGKTPCYKHESAPLAGLVQLAQAPHNEIAQLRMTQAYPYILSSVSGLKVLPEMMDMLYGSIADLLERVPVFRLECLPNEDAARVCREAFSEGV